MLTRRQPVAIAAASDSSSRMPPLISTRMSRAPTISACSSRLWPRPNAASRSTRWIHSAPASCQRSAASTGSPNALLGAGHALDELDGLAVGDVDGGQQLEVGVTAVDPRSTVAHGLGTARVRLRRRVAPAAEQSGERPERPGRRPARDGQPHRPVVAADHPDEHVEGDQHGRPGSPAICARGASGQRARSWRSRRRPRAASRSAVALAARPALGAAPARRARAAALTAASALALGPALGHAPCSQVTATRPSCAAARRRRRRTSRGGTGWPHSGPFSTAATNRSPPCSAQVTSGRAGAAVGLQRPSRARRRSARSRTARPRRRRTASTPPATSTVFQPMCGTTGACSRSTTPGHSSQPSVSTPCSTPRSNSTCMPTQMPSTGRPPASRRPITSWPRDRAQPGHAGGERADAGHDESVGVLGRLPVGGQRRPRRPARSSARTAERRLPEP